MVKLCMCTELECLISGHRQARFSVILEFRQVRFSVIPDFRQVGISITVPEIRHAYFLESSNLVQEIGRP